MFEGVFWPTGLMFGPVWSNVWTIETSHGLMFGPYEPPLWSNVWTVFNIFPGCVCLMFFPSADVR